MVLTTSSPACELARERYCVRVETNIRSRSASGKHRGRPGLVLAIWAALLVLFAALAPTMQELLGVPSELLSAVMLAPALACLVVVILPSWAPVVWPIVVPSRILMSIVAAVVAVTSFVAGLAVLTGSLPSWPSVDMGVPLVLFLALQAGGVLCEELGWRGVVQHAGEQFARPAVVSTIAGFLFGATHLGYWSLGLLPVLTFALTATLMSLTITTIFVGSIWQRMIPAVIVHLGVNLGITAYMTRDEPLATSPSTLGAAVIMVAITAFGRTVVKTRTTPEFPR